MKRYNQLIAYILAFSLTISCIPIAFVNAAISTVPSIAVYPNYTNKVANYQINTYIDNSDVHADIRSIDLRFPVGTTLPKSFSNSTIKVNGEFLDVSSGSITPQSDLRTITVPFPNKVILPKTNQAYVQIEIVETAKITNPNSAGIYQIELSVDGVNWSASNAYSIVDSIVTLPSVTVSPNIVSKPATHLIKFNTSSVGGLKSGDMIVVEFPIDTQLPSSPITAGSIKVNGIPTIFATNILGQSMSIPVPTTIHNNAQVEIIIPLEAGVINPSNEGTYSVWVHTTADTEKNLSISYPIERSVSDVKVWLTRNQVNEVGQYLIGLTNGEEALAAGIDSFSIKFKGDTKIPAHIAKSHVFLNGKPMDTLHPNGAIVTDPTNRSISITIPDSIQSNEYISILFTEAAGIINPSAAGLYNIQVKSSKETGYLPSKEFTISNNPVIVQPPTVSLSPNQYGQYGQYVINFVTSTSVGLEGPNDYIELTFPADTVIPNSISTDNILINGTKLDRYPIISGKRIKVMIPNQMRISAGSSVSLVFKPEARIQNPTASTNHRIQLQTSKDNSYITSQSYTTIGGPSTGQPGTGGSPTLKLSSYEANAPTRYEIVSQAGNSGALVGGTDEITLVFDSRIALPEFIDREHIRVNSIALDTGMVRINKQAVSFRLPSNVSIANMQAFTVTIDEKARIFNPNLEGNYYLYMYTSNNTATSNYFYTIKGQSSYALYVSPSYDSDGRSSSYEMTFKTHLYGSLTGGYDWISITLPRSVTRESAIKELSIQLDGISIDMNKVQISGQTISFFVPTHYDLPRDTHAYISLYDPNKILATNPNYPYSNSSNVATTIKLMTSRDTNWVESNPFYQFDPTYVTTQPTTPVQPTPDTGTPAAPEPTLPKANKSVTLYLNKKDAVIDNKAITLDVAPYTVNGTTVVPLRFFSEVLGAKVDYDENTKRITVMNGTKYIILTVGSDLVYKSNGRDQLAVPVQSSNNRSFVPLRFISEWMGIEVIWNDKNKSIILQK